VGAFGVVDADPLADDLFGGDAVGQFVQLNPFVLGRPPEVPDTCGRTVPSVAPRDPTAGWRCTYRGRASPAAYS
jgi:hypothetical protein